MVECGEEPEIEDEEFDRDNKQISLRTVLGDCRHLEKIEPYQIEPRSWRLRERMKTVSVALVLCLNLPVDPPDVIKLNPCARVEAWIDPVSMPPRNAIEAIGNSLQKCYERWQPKARYKCSRDPTGDEIKKLCVSLRRNSKEERVLFHYNGHGVPRPTDNGEIWVFNSNYTQYIPLYIYDLQQWMGTPSIYVYDCSHAGKILNLFKNYANQDDGKIIQLAACTDKQLLPQNPDLPADLFTACLTSPIQMAIKYYMLQTQGQFLPGVTEDMFDKIPGILSDRRSMIGELNWIFTAITDTIAWNTLPRDLFQKLFRQDLLVASLFRNFLLAQRIMREYNCTPVSYPPLPSANQIMMNNHHMWNAWDLALELSLNNLPRILAHVDPASAHRPAPFFEEQLTSFEVWLSLGSDRRVPPEQLPIVLQVLLSQVYRPRALELLGCFLGLGPWAVNLVLEVGIFPYILKLLQSTAKELRPLLTLLWSKILAVDPHCKEDLLREHGIRYFYNVLKDVLLPVECRAMAAFVLCSLVSNNDHLEENPLPMCLELLHDDHAPLRQWATICAARTWDDNPNARWEATRDNAPDKLLLLLVDPVPEVRAAAAYALGTFLKSLPLSDRSDQGRLINHKIAVNLKNKIVDEASPLVRQEILVALHYVILFYEGSFKEVAKQFYRDHQQLGFDLPSPRVKTSQDVNKSGKMSPSPINRTKNKGAQSTIYNGASPAASEVSSLLSPQGLRKTNSSVSLSSYGMSSLSHEHMYLKVWQCFVTMENDPYPKVAKLARCVTNYMRNKINTSSQEATELKIKDMDTSSDKRILFDSTDSSMKSSASSDHVRRISVPIQPIIESSEKFVTPIISTKYWGWSSNSFMKTNAKDKKFSLRPDASNTEDDSAPSESSCDSHSSSGSHSRHPEVKWTLGLQRVEEQVFVTRNQEPCEVMLFHPFEPLLILGHKNHVSVWDIEKDSRVNFWENTRSGYAYAAPLSCMAVINPGNTLCYLCVGGSDGCVRVWNHAFRAIDNKFQFSRPRTYSNSKDSMDGDIMGNPFLVTAFIAMEENSAVRDNAQFLMNWEQESSCLVVGGCSDKIRLWDLHTEKKFKDINSKGTSVSALHSQGSWVAAGFPDGYLRLFDRRINNPLVREWKDGSTPILNTQIFNSSADSAHIISGYSSGEVRLWDLRRNGSVQVRQPSHKISCMSCHTKAHLFAVGSYTQPISVHHTSGSSVNSIRYYNGIMGHKIGPVTSLTFHPSKVLLGSCTKDGTVIVHGMTRR